MSAPIQFNPKICEALDRWKSANDHLDRAQRELAGAQKEVESSGSELGSYLVPSDAKEDEVFSMWVGDTLIQVWATNGPYGHEYHAKNRDES